MQTYTEDDLKPFSFWVHKKGGNYMVTGLATCSTNGERNGKERSVIYVSLDDSPQRCYYREVSEFLDGRFQRVV